jgi:glycosyltransferase involved in cell wall biosynthesis
MSNAILFVHSSDDLYGADLVLLEIVKRLDRAKFKPIVVLPRDSAHIGLLSEKLKSESIEFVHLPIAVLRRRYFSARHLLPFLFDQVRGTLHLWKLIRKRRIRMVHSSTVAVLSGSFAAALTRVPHLWHVHEILIRPRIVRRAVHFLVHYFSDRVICVSGPVRENFLRDQPSAGNRVTVIHNGIELSTPPVSRDELHRELGLPENTPVVGMIGRVSAWKGQEEFVRAANILREWRVAAQFVAIGGIFDRDHQHLDRLELLIRELRLEKDVLLEGFRPDARKFLYSFDIFVLPSTLPDPFPTVLLEAMSAARPVIATAHGGPLEMVVDNETGLLVPPGDPHSLAVAIADLLKNPEKQEEMGRAGLERVSSLFNVSTFVSRLAEIYESLLKIE